MDNKKPVVNTETAPDLNQKIEPEQVEVSGNLGVDWVQVRVEAIRKLFDRK